MPASSLLVPSRAAVDLDPRRLVRDLVFVLVCLEAIAVLLDLWLYCGGVIASYDLRALFDATNESGLASWLAVTQATLIALTLWVLVWTYKHAGVPRRRRMGWTVLAVFFTYLALDDGTQFHERLGTAFADAAVSEVGLGALFPSYYWQLLLGPFFLAMGLFMVVFLWRELRTGRLRLLVGGAVALLALAVAMDFIEGLGVNHPMNLFARLAESGGLDQRTGLLFGMSAHETVTHLARSVEESIEMLAMTMLWATFLLHFARTVGEVRLRWTPSEEPEPKQVAWVSRRTRPVGSSPTDSQDDTGSVSSTDRVGFPSGSAA